MSRVVLNHATNKFRLVDNAGRTVARCDEVSRCWRGGRVFHVGRNQAADGHLAVVAVVED